MIFIKPKYEKTVKEDSCLEKIRKEKRNKIKRFKYRMAKKNKLPQFVRDMIEKKTWKTGLKIMKKHSKTSRGNFQLRKLLKIATMAIRNYKNRYCLIIDNKEML